MKISLPVQILIALILAVIVGLFFGELTVVLQPIGDAFIMLLKMAVLPYLVFALIHGLGSLAPKQALKILKYGGIFLVTIWVLTMCTLYGMTLAFPSGMDVSHYATHTQAAGSVEQLIGIFIPSNIFAALSNNIVPAVILFSVFFGVAVMMVPSKEPLLKVLDVAIKALSKITRWIIKASPIGIFCLIAATTGQISVAQFEQLAIYLISFVAVACFLTFWLLPVLIATVTKVTYKEYLSALQSGLLLGFATGNIFVTLPYIMEAIEGLAKKHEVDCEEARDLGEAIVPIAYNLPLVGNLMAMLFILFLAYLYGVDLKVADQLRLIPTGLLTLAGPVSAAINGVAFLVDQLKLPTDGVTLFAETYAITRNLQGLAGSAGIAAFTFLTIFGIAGKLRFQPKRLLISISSTVVVFAALVVAVFFIEPEPIPRRAIFPELTITSEVKATIYKPGDKIPPPPEAKEGELALETIRRTGILRVGYKDDVLPFSYFNNKGELVGYDIAYAYALAEALGVDLEFIPFRYEDIVTDIEGNKFDIGMAGITVTGERMEKIAYTQPVATIELILITKDHRREEFGDLAKVEQMKGLRIGVQAGTSFEEIARKQFPKAVIVPVERIEDALIYGDVDVYLWADKQGLPWVLVHPEFTIVNTDPSIAKQFYAYPISMHNQDLLEYTNYWLDLKELDGFSQQEHDKWIRGEIKKRPPRWSILRNVLHWEN